jgi:hypothetical protein
MTKQALQAQASLIQRLRHQTCTSVGIGYASALLLDFGTPSAPDATGYREPELSLVVECPWRLETVQSVLVGSGNDDETISTVIQSLLHSQVEAIAIFQPSFTVRLNIGTVALWIFPDDAQSYAENAEYPRSPWYVTGRGVPSGWHDS